MVSVPVADCSVRADAAAGTVAATSMNSRRVGSTIFTVVASVSPRITPTTLELVPEPVAREIPIADTRPLRQSILRPHQTLEELAAHEPPHDGFAAGVFSGGDLIAVGFIAPEGEPGSWRIRGMATVAEARGQGAGTAVLEALVTHARGRGGTRVWCNARTPARAFYERASFVVTSDEFEVPQIGPHFVMERNLGAASC
jgi:GNAT superfamily N-acetyltransferase